MTITNNGDGTVTVETWDERTGAATAVYDEADVVAMLKAVRG